MSVSSTRFETSRLGKIIQFEEFDISWAGLNPFNHGYCFGSDDGRFLNMSMDEPITAPKQVAPSREAVNGIAFAGRTMAVSTRCDVTFHALDNRSGLVGDPYIYDGGAHDILATSAGGFVAPLGVNGLLRIPSVGDTELKILVNKIRDKRINFYQLALLHGDGKRDIVAASAREDGIFTFDLNSEINNGRPGSSFYFQAPGLDIVNVCSLNSHEWPFAVAGLGADGSIHLFRDILAKEPPVSFRPNNMLGAPYTILQSGGHLFVLTSEAFYSFPNLASRFLDDHVSHGIDRMKKEELRAVDVYVIGDEILIEMVDHLVIARADDLISGPDSSIDSTLESMKSPWTSSSASISIQERAA